MDKMTGGESAKETNDDSNITGFIRLRIGISGRIL
jgi:hypothetical protein